MRKGSEEGQQTMKDPNTSEMVYDPNKIKLFIEDYFKDLLTTYRIEQWFVKTQKLINEIHA